jgi:hypothetical protein
MWTYGPIDKHNSAAAFRSFANAPILQSTRLISCHSAVHASAIALGWPRAGLKCNAQVTAIVTALLRTGLRSSSQPDTEWRTKNRYTASFVAWQRNWFSSVTPCLSKGPAQCVAQIVPLDLTELTDVCVSPTRPDHLTWETRT